MVDNPVTQIIIAAIGIIGGSGGILSFIVAYRNAKTVENSSSAQEWKALYEEMHKRVDDQEAVNANLEREILGLKTKISELTIELAGYKKYDNYIHSLDIYINTLLNVLKPLISGDAYSAILNKRPHRELEDIQEFSDND